MKIIVLDGFLVDTGGQDWSPISRLGEFVYYDMTTARDNVAQRIGNGEIVLTNRCPITAQTISQCPNLRLIHSFGTGYNQIDLDACAQHGVTVTNTPAYGTGAVAQMTLALLLAITRQVSVFDHYVKSKGWLDSIDPHICSIRQFELTGKTIGIIGLGDIGYAVARIAMAMDMNVLAFQRTPRRELECAQLKFTDLDSLLHHSDIISLHCPLTDQTRGLINQSALSKMKQGAILLNTSRGAVLDEDAVLAALEEGKLYALGTDVFSTEPYGKNHPLACHSRCIATPHVAWMPVETLSRVIEISSQTISAFLSGHAKNVVNRK